MKLGSTLVLCLGLLATPHAGCGDSGSEDDKDSEHDEGDGANHEDGHDAEPDCQAITDACHAVDPGTPGDLYDCHSVIAHDNDAATCAKEKDRCVALCEAAEHADGGVGHED